MNKKSFVTSNLFLLSLGIVCSAIVILMYVPVIFAEPEPTLTTNQLDELCRTGQALCQPALGDENFIGGGAIDMDPDLSPSYAYDFAYGYGSVIISLAPLTVGISALFLVPYFILKRKKIPSRPYLALILAGILLFFGIPSFVETLEVLSYYISQPEQINSRSFDQFMFAMTWSTVELSIAGILLFKSSVIRKLIKKRK